MRGIQNTICCEKRNREYNMLIRAQIKSLILLLYLNNVQSSKQPAD